MKTNTVSTAVTARTHRVGSLTLGLTLLLFGVLFLLHTVGFVLSYDWILRLWPVILIILGIEVLLATHDERTPCRTGASVYPEASADASQTADGCSVAYAKDQSDSRPGRPTKVWFFDKTAIWLIILMSFFSMGMAIADMSIRYICQSIGSTPFA